MRPLQVPEPNKGFEIRNIQSGDLMPIRGYGVEILDGGQKQHLARLSIMRSVVGGLGEDELETHSIYASTGNRLVADFDYLRLERLNNDIDTVKLRIQTARNAVFCDALSYPMFSKRHLVKDGPNVTPPSTAALVWDSYTASGYFTIADYHTDLRLRTDGYFDGYIIGDQTFNAWIMVCPEDDALVSGTNYPYVKAAAVNFSGAKPTGMASDDATGYVYSFSHGQTGSSSTVNGRVPYPGGHVRIYVENTSAVSNLTWSALIGLRSF